MGLDGLIKPTLRTIALFACLAVLVALAPVAQARAARYEVIGANPGLRKGITVRHELGFGFSASLTAQQVERLRALGAAVAPAVRHTIACHKSQHRCSGGPTRKVPSDQVPYGVEQAWNVAATQTHPNRSAGAGVTVAVLDTGVYKDHLDLKSRIVACKDATGSGVVDGCSDGHGHGTHVMGTVLADGGSDGKGIFGVAPGAGGMAIKVCDASGSCWSDDIARAIRWAADNGAHIISMSLGADSPSTLEHDAIKYAVGKGVLVVAAAGNDGPAAGSIDYPGAFAEVVAVAAIDSAKVVANWSSRGTTDGNDVTIATGEVEYAQAGVSVLSTSKDGGYTSMSGTSMATPNLAGVAAARCGADRACLRAIVTDVTQSSGGGAAAGYDIASGYGLARVQ